MNRSISGSYQWPRRAGEVQGAIRDEGIMEQWVVQNLKEIIYRLVEDIGLGNELDSIITALRGGHGDKYRGGD